MAWALGNDRSHWNAPGIAAARKAAGDVFSILKVTDGYGTDPSMPANYDDCGHAGQARGGYHFYRSTKDPVKQAVIFATALSGRHWELPPTCDYENQSGPEAADRLLLFLTTVERLTGRTPLIYTGPYWWTSTIGNDPRFARFVLWLAAYPGVSTPPATMHTAPRPWPFVGVWQWTDKPLDRDLTAPGTLTILVGGAAPVYPQWSTYLIPASKTHPLTINDEVKVWGYLLVAAGYHGFIMLGASARIYGSGKVAATKRFQRRHGLHADGIVGPKTWAKMIEVIIAKRQA